MTVKTTLSFTDRHHGFLARKVGEGVFATHSAAVASAVEQMIEDDLDRDLALQAMVETIERRLSTPREDYVDAAGVVATAKARLTDPKA